MSDEQATQVIADGIRHRYDVFADPPDRKLSDAADILAALRDAGYLVIKKVPVMPLGTDWNADALDMVWADFVKPMQADDAPPQSVEDRVLMAILRSVATGLAVPVGESNE